MANSLASTDREGPFPRGETERLDLVPSLKRSLITGGVGFSLVSLCVFATVAFAGRWMYTQLSALGAYLAWTILFILLGGGVLGSVVVGKWRLPRFYALFAIAFFAYAVGWVGAYFALGDGTGEWVGSLAGSVLMATVLAIGFAAARSIVVFSAYLFLANSVGYFFGSALNGWFRGSAGMLLWGVVYGLFLGAGLGAVLHQAQVRGRLRAQGERPSR
jgi:hypothetical protein